MMGKTIKIYKIITGVKFHLFKDCPNLIWADEYEEKRVLRDFTSDRFCSVCVERKLLPRTSIKKS